MNKKILIWMIVFVFVAGVVSGDCPLGSRLTMTPLAINQQGISDIHYLALVSAAQSSAVDEDNIVVTVDTENDNIGMGNTITVGDQIYMRVNLNDGETEGEYIQCDEECRETETPHTYAFEHRNDDTVSLVEIGGGTSRKTDATQAGQAGQESDKRGLGEIAGGAAPGEDVGGVGSGGEGPAMEGSGGKEVEEEEEKVETPPITQETEDKTIKGVVDDFTNNAEKFPVGKDSSVDFSGSVARICGENKGSECTSQEIEDLTNQVEDQIKNDHRPEVAAAILASPSTNQAQREDAIKDLTEGGTTNFIYSYNSQTKEEEIKFSYIGGDKKKVTTGNSEYDADLGGYKTTCNGKDCAIINGNAYSLDNYGKVAGTLSTDVGGKPAESLDDRATLEKLASNLRGEQKYMSYEGTTRLLMGDKYDAWVAQVNEWMSKYNPLSPDFYSEKACKSFQQLPGGENVAYIESPEGIMNPAAHIEAERTTTIDFEIDETEEEENAELIAYCTETPEFCTEEELQKVEELTQGEGIETIVEGAEEVETAEIGYEDEEAGEGAQITIVRKYLYKVTWFINNVQQKGKEPVMEYRVVLKGDGEEMKSNLKKLEEGENDGRSKLSPLLITDKREFDTACLKIEKGSEFMKGLSGNELCNKIVDTSTMEAASARMAAAAANAQTASEPSNEGEFSIG